MLRTNRTTATTLLIASAAIAIGTTGNLRADSPFATQVVEYVPGTGIGNDWISGDPYDDPNTALGRPTVDTTGDDWFIPLDEPVPVVPVYPAFRAFEIVTVGYDGYLTVEREVGGSPYDDIKLAVTFLSELLAAEKE